MTSSLKGEGEKEKELTEERQDRLQLSAEAGWAVATVTLFSCTELTFLKTCYRDDYFGDNILLCVCFSCNAETFRGQTTTSPLKTCHWTDSFRTPYLSFGGLRILWMLGGGAGVIPPGQRGAEPLHFAQVDQEGAIGTVHPIEGVARVWRPPGTHPLQEQRATCLCEAQRGKRWGSTERTLLAV